MTKGMRTTRGRGKFICYHKHHARCAKRDKPIFWINNTKANGSGCIITAAASNHHALFMPQRCAIVSESGAYLAA